MGEVVFCTNPISTLPWLLPSTEDSSPLPSNMPTKDLLRRSQKTGRSWSERPRLEPFHLLNTPPEHLPSLTWVCSESHNSVLCSLLDKEVFWPLVRHKTRLSLMP